jgi:hypothetical protein
MLELSVAAALPHHAPAVLLQQSNELPDLHGSALVQLVGLTRRHPIARAADTLPS